MSNNGKKVAFSFSKVKKSALINKVTIDPKEKVEYVDCFDGSKGKFSYKGNVRNDEIHKQELVIPMPVSRTSADVVKSRIKEKMNKTVSLSSNNKETKSETEETKSEENKKCQNQEKNIEELAASEILKEVKNGSVENKKSNELIIEAKDLPQEPSETDIDYENVPVTDFGLALLRGMGWRPDLGIGKEPRLVDSIPPKLRPKGLGLGAQINAETKNEKKDEEKKLGKMSNSCKKNEKH